MPTGTADIDPEGDIVLVVSNDKVRIFASSCLLCIASKPFAKMLGPNFKEGQIDKASNRREISLPDDKSSAMEILCNILHHRHQASFLPKATDVYDLAILADKYDCIQATALAAAAWIQPNPAHDARDLGLLLISASIYGLPEAFYKTSASLILGHRGTYSVLGDVPDFVERLGWETIRKSALTRCDVHELKVLHSAVGREAQRRSCPDRQRVTPKSERGVLPLEL